MINRIDFSEIEKINIYLNEDIYNSLLHDIDIFDVCRKSDGSINKNDFISRIITNYGETFRNSYSDSFQTIIKVLKRNWITKENNYEKTASEIINALDKDLVNKKDEHDKALPFRPQLKNNLLMTELNEISLFLSQHNNISVSDYFRNMLEEFSKLPTDIKEHYLLLDTYNTIARAIRNRRCLNIEYIIRNSSNKVIKNECVCCPYAIYSSKDTGFNYLLGTIGDEIIVRKLSQITNVSVDKNFYNISDEVLSELERRKKNPEFAYDETSNIYVLLTDQGIKTLRQIKTLRPEGFPVETRSIPKELRTILKDIRNKSKSTYILYCFNSSSRQAEYYFERFGENAIVVSPTDLNSKIKTYYQKAYSAYK